MGLEGRVCGVGRLRCFRRRRAWRVGKEKEKKKEGEGMGDRTRHLLKGVIVEGGLDCCGGRPRRRRGGGRGREKREKEGGACKVLSCFSLRLTAEGRRGVRPTRPARHRRYTGSRSEGKGKEEKKRSERKPYLLLSFIAVGREIRSRTKGGEGERKKERRGGGEGGPENKGPSLGKS